MSDGYSAKYSYAAVGKSGTAHSFGTEKEMKQWAEDHNDSVDAPFTVQHRSAKDSEGHWYTR